MPFCIYFSWGWSRSLSPVQCHEPLSIVLQTLCLSDLIPWIYLSLPLYTVGASLVVQRLKRLPAMWETWVRSLGWEDPLEKEMATHSNTLAWRIPGTGKPGWLPSIGLYRVGHDWSDLAAAAAAYTYWGFPSGSYGKEFVYNARDLGSTPGSGKSPGEGNGYPFQSSCLENFMDQGDWQAPVEHNWTTNPFTIWLQIIEMVSLYNSGIYCISIGTLEHSAIFHEPV